MDELIRESLALKFLASHEVNTLSWEGGPHRPAAEAAGALGI
jgi:hypothetical protein